MPAAKNSRKPPNQGPLADLNTLVEKGTDDDGSNYYAYKGHVAGTPSILSLYFNRELYGETGLAILIIYDGQVTISIRGSFEEWQGKKRLPKQAGLHMPTEIPGVSFLIDFREILLAAKDNPVEFKAEFTLLEGWNASMHNLENASAKQGRFILDKGSAMLQEIGNFRQVQRGGRPKGARPIKTVKEYRGIINHRKRFKTDAQYLRAFPYVSRSKLERAVKWATEEGIWTRWDSK